MRSKFLEKKKELNSVKVWYSVTSDSKNTISTPTEELEPKCISMHPNETSPKQVIISPGQF